MPPVAHALPAPWIDSIPEPLISWRSGGLLSLADLQVLRDGTQPDPIVWAPYFVQQYLTAQQQARIIWRDPVAVDMPADDRQVRDAAIAAYQHPSASMAEWFPVYTAVGGQRAYSLLIVEPGSWIYHWVPGSGSDLNARAFDLADYRDALAARLANRFHLHKAPEVAVGDSFYFLLYAVEKVCDARGSLSPVHLLSPTPRYLQTFRKRLLDRLEQQLSPRRIAPRIRRLPFVRLLEDLGARYPEHGAEILQVFQLALRCDDQAGLPRRARSLDAYRTAEADLKRSRDELYQALLRLLEHQLPFLLPASRTLGLVQTAPAFWRRGEIEWTHKVRGEKVLMDRWAYMEWQVLRLIHLRLDALEALPSPTAGEQAELKTLVYALWRIEVHLFLYDKNTPTPPSPAPPSHSAPICALPLPPC
ncbi:MAG: hypothetical protein OHK0039_47470 [Bacteroidia bacterium]